MDMQKIMVIGSAGAGKSTFSRKLGDKLNKEVIHLDKIFWKPNWEATEREQWTKIIKELSSRDSWIIDGNYGSTLEIRMKNADTIIFLDFPRNLCMFRVIKRRYMYMNKKRSDMAEGCKEKLDKEFLKWVWNYPKVERPQVLSLIKSHEKNKRVIILKNSLEVEEFLRNID